VSCRDLTGLGWVTIPGELPEVVDALVDGRGELFRVGA
jgi:hypothetical protein